MDFAPQLNNKKSLLPLLMMRNLPSARAGRTYPIKNGYYNTTSHYIETGILSLGSFDSYYSTFYIHCLLLLAVASVIASL